MLSKCEFTPNGTAKSTSVLAFDVGGINNALLPITDIQFEYTRQGEIRPKMELHGSWAGFNKVNAILIHMSFDVIGVSTSDFNSRKRTLNNKFLPSSVTALLQVETLGTLKLRFDGDTEDMQAPVTIDGDISIPYVGPAYSNAQMTWIVPQGYFTGVTTPSNIYFPK